MLDDDASRAETTVAPQTLRLFVVRHGETEWSLSGRHTGRTDIALTANGERQARELRPRLERVRFSAVVCSPRLRARRTCELAGLDSKATIDPDLAEWDYGEYEGLRTIDIARDRPLWNIFADGCPGGETPQAIGLRADRLIARLRALAGNVALFSHGQFSCVLAARWIGLPVLEAQRLAFGPASLGVLGSDPHHPLVAQIERWNVPPEPADY
jgi:probable phosphoglycerate mutase